jgi:hypothetical protein
MSLVPAASVPLTPGSCWSSFCAFSTGL